MPSSLTSLYSTDADNGTGTGQRDSGNSNDNGNDKRDSARESGSGSGYMKRHFNDRSVSDKSHPEFDLEPIQVNNNNSNNNDHSNTRNNNSNTNTRNQRRRDSKTSRGSTEKNRGSTESKGNRQSLVDSSNSTGIRQPLNSQETPILVLDPHRALVKPSSSHTTSSSRRSSIGTFSPESGLTGGNATNLELSNYHRTHGSFPTSIEDAPPSSFLNSLTMANIFNSLKSSLTNSSRSMLSSVSGMGGALDTSAIMKSELEQSLTDGTTTDHKFDDHGNFGSHNNESDQEDGSENFSHSIRGLFGDSVRMNPDTIANSSTKSSNQGGVEQSFTMSLRGLFGDSMRGAGGVGGAGSSGGGMDLFNSTEFANDSLPTTNPTFDTIVRRLSMNNGSDHTTTNSHRLAVTNETTPLFTIVNDNNDNNDNLRPSALGAAAKANNNQAVPVGAASTTKNPRAIARASARTASTFTATTKNQPGWSIYKDVVSSAKSAAAAAARPATTATSHSQQPFNYGTTTTPTPTPMATTGRGMIPASTPMPTPMMATIRAPGYQQEGHDIVSAAMAAAQKSNMQHYAPNNNNTTTTTKSKQREEGLVQSKLKNLSMSQRQRGMFDLHGMSEVPTEDPHVLQQLLIEMNKHIIALYYHSIMAMNSAANKGNQTDNDGSTDTGSSTLGWAYTNYPEYVGKEKLKFLRAQCYQPKQAVQAMSVYYEKKRYYFGLGNLCTDITMDLLTETDLYYYKQGGIQLLEGRDRSGRTVSMEFGKRSEYIPIDSAIRIMMYMSQVLSKDDRIQLSGYVHVIFAHGMTTNLTNRNELVKTKELMACRSCMPIKCVGKHFCYHNKNLDKSLFGVLVHAMDPFQAIRFRFHYGTLQECIYNLMTYGIVHDTIPILYNNNTMGGTSNTEAKCGEDRTGLGSCAADQFDIDTEFHLAFLEALEEREERDREGSNGNGSGSDGNADGTHTHQISIAKKALEEESKAMAATLQQQQQQVQQQQQYLSQNQQQQQQYLSQNQQQQSQPPLQQQQLQQQLQQLQQQQQQLQQQQQQQQPQGQQQQEQQYLQNQQQQQRQQQPQGQQQQQQQPQGQQQQQQYSHNQNQQPQLQGLDQFQRNSGGSNSYNNNNNNNTNNSSQYPPSESEYGTEYGSESEYGGESESQYPNKKNDTTTTTNTTTTATTNTTATVDVDTVVGGMIEPGPLDIIMGRGCHNTNKSGNVRLKQLLETYYEQYNTTRSKNAKSALVANIFQQIQQSGSRFLVQSKDQPGHWDIAPYKKAHDKIAHDFRNMRRKAAQLSTTTTTSTADTADFPITRPAHFI